MNVTLLLTKMVGLVFRFARAPAPPLLHPSLAHKLGHRGCNLIENYEAQTCAFIGTMNLPLEARQCAKLLRATPNCRLVLMVAYHIVCPELSAEEASLMSHFQTPPDAGPALNQITIGLPANSLHQAFVKILSAMRSFLSRKL